MGSSWWCQIVGARVQILVRVLKTLQLISSEPVEYHFHFESLIILIRDGACATI